MIYFSSGVLTKKNRDFFSCMGGAAKNNFFCAFTEKFFGAYGISTGLAGSVIAYAEKIRAPKAREK